jgi:hypothetical protein
MNQDLIGAVKLWLAQRMDGKVLLVAQAFQPAVAQVCNLRIVEQPKTLAPMERAHDSYGQPAGKHGDTAGKKTCATNRGVPHAGIAVPISQINTTF